MKNFKTWGIRVRRDISKNYYSIWNDLITTRLDLGDPAPLEPSKSEFYDVGITERCNAACPFCYVSADPGKQDYTDICETWKYWLGTFPTDSRINPNKDEIFSDILKIPAGHEDIPDDMTATELQFQVETFQSFLKYGAVYTTKPYQVAIGSVGEPTIHPDFPKFLQTIFETRVVPNYTTNGILLADQSKSGPLLEATKNFCGGVAVSFGNKALRDIAKKALENLLKHGDCKVMIHEIIGTKSDVDDLFSLDSEFGSDIHYHVLLPLMAHGRSKKSMDTETYVYLTDRIREAGMTNVAFGANFLPFMKSMPGSVSVWEYPSETYSKNLLIGSGHVKITPNSFRATEIISDIAV